jgi:hypothetical protein
MEPPTGDTVVGVALSGGGTRAALFGAAGLQALAGVRMADGGSLVDKITYLSSVSGGSLAATYYALKKPGRAVPVLDADGCRPSAIASSWPSRRPSWSIKTGTGSSSS